jgi:hypothetical protein
VKVEQIMAHLLEEMGSSQAKADTTLKELKASQDRLKEEIKCCQVE